MSASPMSLGDLGWYVVHGDMVKELLERAHGGEDPDTLLIELYANCERES